MFRKWKHTFCFSALPSYFADVANLSHTYGLLFFLNPPNFLFLHVLTRNNLSHFIQHKNEVWQKENSFWTSSKNQKNMMKVKFRNNFLFQKKALCFLTACDILFQPITHSNTWDIKFKYEWIRRISNLNTINQKSLQKEKRNCQQRNIKLWYQNYIGHPNKSL